MLLAQISSTHTPALVFFSLCANCFLSLVGSLFCAHPMGYLPPPTSPLCVCAVSCALFFFYFPACMHTRHCCTSFQRLRLLSGPPAPVGFFLLRSPAVAGGRCSLAQPPLCSPPRPTPRRAPLSRPPYCSPPALCAPPCSSLRQGCILRALTRTSACARSFFRWADLGGLQGYPSGGIPASSAPASLPPIYFPDCGAGRLVRLNGSHWHGVDLWAMWYSCLLLFAPPVPLPPRVPVRVLCPRPPVPLWVLRALFATAHTRRARVPRYPPLCPCPAALTSLSLPHPPTPTHFPHPASES